MMLPTKYGVLLTPKYGQKCKFYRVTQNLRGFAHIALRYNLPPSQPRFLARLPRWQQQVILGAVHWLLAHKTCILMS